MQSAGDRADAISKFATLLGDPALVNRQLEQYRAVTADDVTAFAREVLGADNRASLVYVPRSPAEVTS
jgi:predicted Zn-dependent peptidase